MTYYIILLCMYMYISISDVPRELILYSLVFPYLTANTLLNPRKQALVTSMHA